MASSIGISEREGNENRSFSVSVLLEKCFNSSLYPILGIKEKAIVYQNPSAADNEPLVIAVNDYIKKSGIDDNKNVEANGIAYRTYKLIDCDAVQVFLFVETHEPANSNDLYEQLIRQLAHEFRTPLNSIMGFTEIMLEESDDEAMREYLLAILRASESLISMLTQVLDFGRISARKFSIEPTRVEIQSFVELLRFFFLPQALRNQLEFKVNILNDIPPFLIFDEGRVRQILFNLISNALKYTSQGYVHVDLRVEHQGGDRLQLLWEIKDTGSGLPSWFYEKGIAEYERGDSQSAIVDSAGLGLIIAQRMSKALGGELSYRKGPEKGTIFSFRIEAKIYPTTGEEIKFPSKALSGRCILLIDELPTSFQRYKSWIEQAGGEVWGATSFSEARNLLMQFLPDAIISVLNPLQLESLREILILLKRPPFLDIKPSIAIIPQSENRKEIPHTFDLVIKHPLCISEFINRLGPLFHVGSEVMALNAHSLFEALSAITSNDLHELKSLMDKYLPNITGFHDLEKEKIFAEKLIHWALKQNSNYFVNFGKTLLLYLNRFEVDHFENYCISLKQTLDQVLLIK